MKKNLKLQDSKGEYETKRKILTMKIPLEEVNVLLSLPNLYFGINMVDMRTSEVGTTTESLSGGCRTAIRLLLFVTYKTEDNNRTVAPNTVNRTSACVSLYV